MKKLLTLMVLFTFVLAGCAFANESEIHKAAHEGNLAKIKELIKKDPTLVNQQNREFQSSPLHLASAEGHVKVMLFLLEKGADVNLKNGLGWAPIHMAAAGGQKEAVIVLLKHKSDVNALDTAKYTPLHHAATWGQNEVVELLIKKGAKVNARDRDGKTPLKWAEEMGKKKTVEILKKHGGTE